MEPFKTHRVIEKSTGFVETYLTLNMVILLVRNFAIVVDVIVVVDVDVGFERERNKGWFQKFKFGSGKREHQPEVDRVDSRSSGLEPKCS